MTAIPLTEIPAIKTTCPYCGVGCGVDAKVVDNQVVSVAGSNCHPANKGLLCVKGSALHETNSLKGRLLSPFVNNQEVSWQTALDTVAKGFQESIEKHGPDSVAFYLSGQLLTEDYYVANKLMKGFIGSANVDTNSRLCMASAVAGYKRALGSDTVPLNYQDLENCDLLVMVGSNAAWTHPVLYQRIVAAKKKRPHMKIVVIDPKQTATADIADLTLNIKPGSDAILFRGLLSYLVKTDNSIDNHFIEEHTQGFEESITSAQIEVEETAVQCGIAVEDLHQLFDWFDQTEKTISFYSQGINQSAKGTDKCNAIINCHLATGRIGKPGMGPFSITGQPNAMGGREVGGLANQLAAHMDFSAEDRDRVGRFWGSQNIAHAPGLKAVDLFEALEEGKIKAIWIMATNPVVSMPEANRVKAALEKCPLVVVSDCVAKTDTIATANVLLPATGWGEKEGTVTNSERCISRQRALLKKPGQAKHDWEIICEVAKLMGYGEDFDYQSPRDIFAEHAALSGFENAGSRDFDISKFADISVSEYQNFEPVQWPVNEANPKGSSQIFSDGKFFTDTGKARFIPVDTDICTASVSAETPFLLNTGRVRDQWHTMTRTSKSARLMTHTDLPYVEISTEDATEHNIAPMDLVEVSNSSGRICLPARVSNAIKQGQLFAPIHWNDQLAYPARVDSLVPNRFDPVSGQPESKNVPVSIKARKSFQWLRLITTDDSLIQALTEIESPQFWARVQLQQAERIDIAFDSELSYQQAIALFADADLRFESEKFSSFLVRKSGLNQSFIQTAKRFDALPDIRFIQSIVGQEARVEDWLSLAGRSVETEDLGAMICSCYEVHEKTIQAAISNGASSSSELGSLLKCGTNCGSCIPELNHLISAYNETTISVVDAA